MKMIGAIFSCVLSAMSCCWDREEAGSGYGDLDVLSSLACIVFQAMVSVLIMTQYRTLLFS